MPHGLQMSQLVICPTCAKQRSTGCAAIDLTLMWLRCSAFIPTIDNLPDRAVLLFPDDSMSLTRFLFWTIYLCISCSLGITQHPCVGKLQFNPDQRAATAMPCGSVYRGEYTLNLGQMQITSNPVGAPLTVLQRSATNPSPNPNDLNHHSNPKRNACCLISGHGSEVSPSS